MAFALYEYLSIGALLSTRTGSRKPRAGVFDNLGGHSCGKNFVCRARCHTWMEAQQHISRSRARPTCTTGPTSPSSRASPAPRSPLDDPDSPSPHSGARFNDEPLVLKKMTWQITAPSAGPLDAATIRLLDRLPARAVAYEDSPRYWKVPCRSG